MLNVTVAQSTTLDKWQTMGLRTHIMETEVDDSIVVAVGKDGVWVHYRLNPEGKVISRIEY